MFLFARQWVNFSFWGTASRDVHVAKCGCDTFLRAHKCARVISEGYAVGPSGFHKWLFLRTYPAVFLAMFTGELWCPSGHFDNSSCVACPAGTFRSEALRRVRRFAC